jgi:signal transduction histidine kinase
VPEALLAHDPRHQRLSTGVSKFQLEFYLEEDGTPRAVVSRRVFALENLANLPLEAECLRPLVKGFQLQQGFFVDVEWLFQELPFFIAGQALGETEDLISALDALDYDKIDTVFADILPVRDLGFSAATDEELAYGKLEVSIDTDHIEQRYLSHLRRFLGVALMLVLSLATGFTLLYRSVRRELEQAHRTQNFVASVTHELRTPLSTIQLHGEMLMDGWVDDPDKRREYYKRIVRETRRLSTLVERVLEKSQMKEKVSEPEPGDLNAAIQRMRQSLLDASDTPDLAFELEPDLPLVWLTPDGVTGILSNLVENARKYAPVPPGGEPIAVRTRREDRRVVLEVADRGPGVPPEEKDKIFEAFYRIGSEATRTTTGTGLGLHLVKLHADAAGAKASVLPRAGGGSCFRVTYRIADERPVRAPRQEKAVKAS